MSYQTPPIGGYSCPLCRAWVPLGQIHSCASGGAPAPAAPTVTVQTQTEPLTLHRIALALERIAAVLEGADTKAQP